VVRGAALTKAEASSFLVTVTLLGRERGRKGGREGGREGGKESGAEWRRGREGGRKEYEVPSTGRKGREGGGEEGREGRHFLPGQNVLCLLVKSFLCLHPLDVRARGGVELALQQVLGHTERVLRAGGRRSGRRSGGA